MYIRQVPVIYLVLWRYWGIHKHDALQELDRRGIGKLAQSLLKVLLLPFISHDRFVLITQAEELYQGIEHTTITKSALYSLAWSLPLVALAAFALYPTHLFYLYAASVWPLSGIFFAYFGYSILKHES